MNEKLLKELEKYIPYDDVEKASVETFLYFLKCFGDDIWTRENLIGHITGSAWVINQTKTKVLMVYHNIYDSFAWLGGHSDGEKDMLKLAMKEVEEESGLCKITPLNNGKFFDVNVINVPAHIKRGKNITPHLHLDLAYLFQADDRLDIRIMEDENSAVSWIENKKIPEIVKEKHMLPIYDRLMKKAEKI